jgi:predicted RNase H-like nuclease (RuvC/YqgF family)
VIYYNFTPNNHGPELFTAALGLDQKPKEETEEEYHDCSNREHQQLKKHLTYLEEAVSEQQNKILDMKAQLRRISKNEDMLDFIVKRLRDEGFFERQP